MLTFIFCQAVRGGPRYIILYLSLTLMLSKSWPKYSIFCLLICRESCFIFHLFWALVFSQGNESVCVWVFVYIYFSFLHYTKFCQKAVNQQGQCYWNTVYKAHIYDIGYNISYYCIYRYTELYAKNTKKQGVDRCDVLLLFTSYKAH